MNSKKVWSLLLLFAMSFSIAHDYSFMIIENDKHSVKEYISELTASVPDTKELSHQLHGEFHVLEIATNELFSFGKIEKEINRFFYNEIVFSFNYFNFFKPPIA